MNTMEEQPKKCVRCHNMKPCLEYVGVRGQVKTCKRCRDDGVRHGKLRTKEKMTLYNKNHTAKHGHIKRERGEYQKIYQKEYKARKKAEATARELLKTYGGMLVPVE
jgi:hypothetical protein